jgi:hypothetical protein
MLWMFDSSNNDGIWFASFEKAWQMFRIRTVQTLAPDVKIAP